MYRGRLSFSSAVSVRRHESGNPLKPLRRVAAAAIVAFGLDRLSKLLVLRWLDLDSVHFIRVWPPWLDLVMAWNRGINFGLLGEYLSRWVLVGFAVACSIALVTWARDKAGWIRPLAAGLAVGGALGNALDRVLYGAVADYLNVGCCGIENPYAFNIADIFVLTGMGLIAVLSRRDSRRV